MVLAVDEARRQVTLSHAALPGVMPAMVMPFDVAPGEPLSRLRAGQRVRAELTLRQGRGIVRRLRPYSVSAATPGLPAAAPRLRIGEALPDFQLIDQRGQPVDRQTLRGRSVALHFIYTRCPLAEVCPRLASQFARLQRDFADRLEKDLALVSITLDPQHDTPAVLRQYGERWRAQWPAWRFLTGEEDQVQRLAGRLGVVYWAEEDAITHAVTTAVLDRETRLAAFVEGSTYTYPQLADLVSWQWRKGAQ